MRKSDVEWTTGSLVSGSGAYCALGMVAHHFGVSATTLRTHKVSYGHLAGIFDTNDNSSTKKEVVEKLAARGKRKYAVGAWVKRLLKLQRGEQ